MGLSIKVFNFKCLILLYVPNQFLWIALSKFAISATQFLLIVLKFGFTALVLNIWSWAAQFCYLCPNLTNLIMGKIN